MSLLEEALGRVASAVADAGYEFAVVGGLAVSARAEPRLTRDADLAVAVTDDEAAERLLQQLRGAGYVADALVEQTASGRLATARLVNELDAGLVMDLLFASSGIEPEIVAGADRIQVTPTLVLPVASVGHLIATKLLARDDRSRPADADDLRALASAASDRDWQVATDAVALIERRGYQRGRDLAGALAPLRTTGAY